MIAGPSPSTGVLRVEKRIVALQADDWPAPIDGMPSERRHLPAGSGPGKYRRRRLELSQMEMILAESTRAAEALGIEQSHLEFGAIALVAVGDIDLDASDARGDVERMFLIRTLVRNRDSAPEGEDLPRGRRCEPEQRHRERQRNAS